MFIKTIKETLSQVLFSDDSTKLPFWDDTDIECSIDETLIDCKDLQEDYDEGEAFKNDAINYYTGVPAPAYLEDDPWFGPAPPKTVKQLDYMEKETEMKKKEEERRLREYNGEPCNIHQLMYEMATSNWKNVEPYEGGSENLHEKSKGWNSGNGFSQFASDK